MSFLSDMMVLMLADNLAEQQALRDEIDNIKNEYESGLYEDDCLSEEDDSEADFDK